MENKKNQQRFRWSVILYSPLFYHKSEDIPFLCFASDKKNTKWPFMAVCCRLCLCMISSYFSHSYAHVCLCKSLGEVFCQHSRKYMGVFDSHEIHSLFSMCPRGWKAAESSNRDTLPHALHGKSSEIKGFVCTTNSKHCSQSLTWQSRRIKEPR